MSSSFLETSAAVNETLPAIQSARVVVSHSGFQAEMFAPTYTSAQAKLWVAKVLTPDFHLSHLDCISPEAAMLFSLKFRLHDHMYPATDGLPPLPWNQLPNKSFARSFFSFSTTLDKV